MLEQPARNHQQRQGQRQPVQEDAQFLGTRRFIVRLHGRGFQRLPVALDAFGLLGGVEHGLALGFHRAQGLALLGFQAVEGFRAVDEFGVLVGPRRDAARGEPVIERGTGRGRVRARHLVLLLGPLECGAGGGLLVLGRIALGLQRGEALRVHELLDRQGRLDVPQVFDDLAAQPDQEGGENESNQPQRAAHPPLGQAQTF